MKKVLTLVYLVKEQSICLGLKKRGFGEGNWNGFGGKVEEGETIEDSALRELKEESRVGAHKKDLEKVAVIEFFFTDGRHLEVHAYFIEKWEGNPVETEEMRPAWFHFDDIPYDRMWADDIHWLPRALDGERIRGTVWFKEDGKMIEQMEWKPV